jgi:hypothetical protein
MLRNLSEANGTTDRLKFPPIALFTEEHFRIGRLRPSLFWLTCFILGTTVSAAITRAAHQPVRYLLLCLILDLGAFLVVPAGLHVCHRIFLTWACSVDGFVRTADQEPLRRWYRRELLFFEGSKQMLFAATLFASVAIIAYNHSGYLDRTYWTGYCWATFQLFISAFMAGCGLWMMYCAAHAVAELGKQYKDCVVVTVGRFGVLSTGRTLARCWAIIGMAWFVYTSTVFLGPPIRNAATIFITWPVLLLAVPTLPLIVGLFIGCQLPLHYAMVAYKERELRRIDQMLARFTPVDIEGLTKQSLDRIEFLHRRSAEAEALPEWPFASRSLASVFGSTITALFPVLLKVALTTDIAKQYLPDLRG